MGRDPSVVVTGGVGQVGRALRSLLPGARYLSRAQLDVTDWSEVNAAIEDTDVVVHLAAMTRVDDCQTDPELAQRVNSEGTKYVVEAARRSHARVIYTSTDYVFDGTRRTPYLESDPPAPINAYGRSKLAGERHVAQELGNLIVRTSWVYGEGPNFVRTILSAARNQESLDVVDDQVGRPTHAKELARALAGLISSDIAGVINVTGDGRACSWADVAEQALAAAGSDTKVQRVDTEAFRAGSRRLVAARPANSLLSLERAKTLQVHVVDWEVSLRSYVGTLR